MQDLDHSFSGLESKAEILHAAQARQAEMQAYLHNQTQVEMQASQSLLANVTLSARGLHEAVDNAAAKVAKMAWFGAIPEELLKLGWLVLAVAVLHYYSPKHAKFVAAVIGAFPWVIRISMLIRSHRLCDTSTRFWYSKRHLVDPFGPGTDSLCYGLQIPFLAAHQTCRDSRCRRINLRHHLQAHKYLHSVALPHLGG